MRICRSIGVAVLVAVALAAFTPAVTALAWWMAGPARLGPADAIVVLASGDVDPGVTISTASLRRTLHGVSLYKLGLAPALILSGFPGEVEARAEIAEALGVPSPALLTEARARTTRGEALLIRERLLALGARRVLLVADVVDMPRARGAFVRVGFAVLSAPVDPGEVTAPDGRLGLAREALSEGLAWSYYRVAGYL